MFERISCKIQTSYQNSKEWKSKGHCNNNNIILMILLPHSSHLTQSLNVEVLDPLKKYMATEIDRPTRTGLSRIHKIE